ncbi:MAG: hypothetical protein II649_11540 [Kiritimatiellae bacterium]|nr:hypothetical protein [Kiritimatiellia bacterium]
MNDELERDLTAAGGGLLPFAESLRRAPAAHAAPGFAENVMAKVRRRKRLTWLRPVAFAAAASAAAAVALTAVVDTSAGKPSEEVLMAHQRADGSFTASSASPHVQAFAVSALARKGKPAFHALQLAVNALIRSQGADGGWGSAGLSARNVAALSAANAAGLSLARPAYLRGLRYLRTHGIAEMSAADFSREAKDALARIGTSPDVGLMHSAALASRL